MMNKKPMISVIIPVYNVEKYIDECLLSVVNQTIGIKNIEVIVVNDCTPDNSMDIVNKYVRQYPDSFVIVNNEVNKGLGASRNIGLDKSSGEFIAFLDSDDFLDANMFEYGIKNMQKNDVNLFLYQFKYFNEKTGQVFTKSTTDANYRDNDYVIKNKDLIKYPYLIHEVSTCNKIYKKDYLINNVKFTEGHKFEDMFFCIMNIYNSDIYITNKVRYNYRKRITENSITDMSFGSVESYNDQISELLKVKRVVKYYPQLQGIIDWFLLYTWSAFLHNLILDKINIISETEKQELFEKTKLLWNDIDINNIIEDRVELHHKKILKFVKLNNDFEPVAKLYKRRIFLYKLHSRLPGFIRRYDTTSNKIVKFIREKYRKLPTKLGNYAPQIIHKKMRLFFEWQSVKKEIDVLQKNIKNIDKGIWLFAERESEARDNASVLFKYIRKEYPSIPAYYVIDKKSTDYNNIKESGHILDYGSDEHKKYFLSAEYLISSHARGTIEPWDKNMLNWFDREYKKKKYIFLQHGVIKDDITSILNKKKQNFDIFICGAKPEYDFVLDKFGYDESVVKYTGLARYDNLHNFETKNQILFMPTWRNEICQPSWMNERIVKDDVFLNSEYYTRFQDLINNGKLQGILEQNNIELIFYPHFEVQQYLKYFYTKNKNIKIASKENYDVATLLKESKLLITDYSSVFFDFAYMQKPMIYYQFDEEEFFAKHYKKGYFDYRDDGFGSVVTKEKDLIEKIQKVIQNNFEMEEKYKKRIDGFFPLHDRRNCERIVNVIENMSN